MAKAKKNASDLTATNLLYSLRCRGGSNQFAIRNSQFAIIISKNLA